MHLNSLIHTPFPSQLLNCGSMCQFLQHLLNQFALFHPTFLSHSSCMILLMLSLIQLLLKSILVFLLTFIRAGLGAVIIVVQTGSKNSTIILLHNLYSA